MADDDRAESSDEVILPEVLPEKMEVPLSLLQSHSSSSQSVTVSASVLYKGELPPPWMLRECEDICPGYTDRILKMAEQQATHRQKMESGVVFGNLFNARLASVLGTVLGLAIILLSGYLASKGLSGQGIALVLIEIAAIVGVALNRNSTKSKERIAKDKNKQLPKQKQIEPSRSDAKTED